MVRNVLEIWPEILGVAGGAAILMLFALAISVRNKPTVQPGSSGHRERGREHEGEENRPDGYIDSFAGVIEEAGGGMPLIVRIALPGIIVWWLVYLIVNWTPG
jgi:hypothetical protein